MPAATPVTPLDLLPPGETRHDDYYDNITASTKLGYDFSDHLDLGFVGHASESLGEITGDACDPVTFLAFPAPSQTRIYTKAMTAAPRRIGIGAGSIRPWA